MLDRKEIDIEIARLEYGESSYPAYAKLANLYTIREQLDRESTPAPAAYSAAPAPEGSRVEWMGESDFLRAVKNMDQRVAWSVMDELMDTLQVANERVYNGVMRKLRSI